MQCDKTYHINGQFIFIILDEAGMLVIVEDDIELRGTRSNRAARKLRKKNVKITPKRYVFFIGTLMQGGAERVISILSKKMIEKGMDVSILLYYDREIVYDIDPNIKITVVERETQSKNILKNIFWIRNFITKKADVLISFLAPFNILALVAHIGLKSKIIVADRNDPRYVPTNRIVRQIRNVLYHYADGVVLQTTQNRDYFSDKIKANSIIIPNPIDLKEKVGIALRTPKENKIVSVGRLMPQKNQELLIRAFTQIHQKYPQYTLEIYGDGPYRGYLENVVSKLKMNDYIKLVGSSKRIFDDIANAELFVLSSNYEGMPNALIEAMCLGLPCISTKVSGATDLIKSGVNGEIVDIGNLQELATVMADLLSRPEKRESYGKAAKLLNDKLAVEKVMNYWINFFENISDR